MSSECLSGSRSSHGSAPPVVWVVSGLWPEEGTLLEVVWLVLEEEFVQLQFSDTFLQVFSGFSVTGGGMIVRWLVSELSEWLVFECCEFESCEFGFNWLSFICLFISSESSIQLVCTS